MHDVFGVLLVALPAIGLVALVFGIAALRRPADVGRKATRSLVISSCLGLVTPPILAVLGNAGASERGLTLIVFWSLSLPFILMGVGLMLLSKLRLASIRPGWKTVAWGLVTLGALWGLATGYVATHLGKHFCC